MDSIISKIKNFLPKAKNVLALVLLPFKKFFQKEFSNGQADLDKKLISSLSKSKIPNWRQFKYITKVLNEKESRLLKICFFVIIINLTILGINFCQTHLKTSPEIGGEYVEGLIGSPKYVNPLYSGANDVDNDICGLVFSGLFKRNADGELVNDLAEGYNLSDDKKSYSVSIKKDVKWDNGNDLTIDDVVFTFNAIIDPAYKSPLRLSFSGVSIEKVDDTTIKFTLSEPYAAFPDLLTFGILPQEIWMPIAPESANLAEYNLKPVGSGPFKFKSLTKDKSGNIKTYALERNDNYFGQQKSFIKTFVFKFFPNTEEIVSALNENGINGIGYLPVEAKSNLVALDSLNIHNLNLPQVNAIFFNQSKNEALKDKNVRQALATGINKNDITNRIFGGDALPIDGPIPPNSFAYNGDAKKYKFDADQAKKLLTDAGWKEATIAQADLDKAQADTASEDEKIKKAAELAISMGAGTWRRKGDQYLTINLTTVENNTNLQVAEIIKELWEKIGVKVNLNIVPVNQIQTSIIKQRDFEALFYGQFIGGDPDSYVFWHSSQIGQNGLNIANYSNKEVDTLLEDARLSSNIEDRKNKYKRFQEIIADDLPAIFLYSPTYTYVQSKKINGFNIKNIYSPSDRFSNVEEWFVKTGKKLVW